MTRETGRPVIPKILDLSNIPCLDDPSLENFEDMSEDEAYEHYKKSESSQENIFIQAPPHYVEGRQFQPINVIEDWGLDADHYLANALKYIARYGRKDSPGDKDNCLKKAIFYLRRRLERNAVEREAGDDRDRKD